jgi:hypothetical protein
VKSIDDYYPRLIIDADVPSGYPRDSKIEESNSRCDIDATIETGDRREIINDKSTLSQRESI